MSFEFRQDEQTSFVNCLRVGC